MLVHLIPYTRPFARGSRSSQNITHRPKYLIRHPKPWVIDIRLHMVNANVFNRSSVLEGKHHIQISLVLLLPATLKIEKAYPALLKLRQQHFKGFPATALLPYMIEWARNDHRTPMGNRGTRLQNRKFFRIPQVSPVKLPHVMRFRPAQSFKLRSRSSFKDCRTH